MMYKTKYSIRVSSRRINKTNNHPHPKGRKKQNNVPRFYNLKSDYAKRKAYLVGKRDR